jgi:RNA polymerase sigma factor (sigma-70 family)
VYADRVSVTRAVVIRWRLPMSADEDLLEAWRSGDARAGEALFQRHFEPVRRFFANKVGAAGEDLIQRTFVGCLEARDRFAGRSSFRTFLFAIANNVLREHFRKAKRDAAHVDFDEVSVADLGHGPGPGSLLVNYEEQRLLLLALRAMPLALQVILELHYWERLTGAEMAEVLGIPENTARSRLRRSKEKLEEALSRLASSAELIHSTATNLEQWAAGVRQHLCSTEPHT